MKTTPKSQRGVSLIEALVAMAVMAFGMIALLGLQGALRGNSDISKQRAEAVRFAQQKVEQRRGFSVLDTVAGTNAYADISSESSSAVTVSGYASSTSFSRESSVLDIPPLTGTLTDEELYYMARRKQVVVRVTWADRNNEAQAVQLNTIVARTAPEVIGALSVAGIGSVVQQPGFRHVGIPPGAMDLTDQPGKSIFAPPGSSGLYWKFDNSNGRILESCTNVAGTGCSVFNGYLLSGYIRYAVNSGQPDSTQAEMPPDLALPVAGVVVGMVVHTPAYSEDADATPVRCYVDTAMFHAYYCAMQVSEAGTSWSGRATVTFNRCWSRVTRHDGFPPTYPDDPTHPYRCESSSAALFADSVTDNNSARFRVCRYTTRRDQSVVGAGTPPFRNYEHPLDYLGVNESLSNQSLLITRAGDGATVYTCPDDDASTPLNGTTWYHQPPT